MPVEVAFVLAAVLTTFHTTCMPDHAFVVYRSEMLFEVAFVLAAVLAPFHTTFMPDHAFVVYESEMLF